MTSLIAPRYSNGTLLLIAFLDGATSGKDRLYDKSTRIVD